MKTIKTICSKFYLVLCEFASLNLKNRDITFFKRMGYSEEVYKLFSSQKVFPPPDVRFDIIVSNEGLSGNLDEDNFKIIEVNTPQHGLYWMANIVNGLVCNFYGSEDANLGMDLLSCEILKKYYQIFGCEAHDLFLSTPGIFTENKLDLLSKVSKLEELNFPVNYEDLENSTFLDLSTSNPGMYFNKKKAKLLDLKLLPERYINFWYPPNSNCSKARPWNFFEELIISNNLTEANSSLGYILENKSLLAYLWQNKDDTKSADFISKVLPKTLLELSADSFEGKSFWRKPIHGLRSEGVVKTTNQCVSNENVLEIYQEHCEPCVVNIAGQNLETVFSCFVSHDGTPTSVVARCVKEGEVFSSKRELFLPLAIS